jgi:hypothetical protein
MRCLVTVCKHILVEMISSLLLGNRRDNNRLLKGVFSVGSALELYNEDTSRAAISCQQLCLVK